MSITIEELSKHLGISVSTVSKALNGYADVASTTRERVMTAARELDYQPSSVARNLRRGRTDKIGFVFNNAFTFIRDYFAEVIIGATAAAESHGNNIVLYTNDGHSPESLLSLFRSRDVDGFVIIWNHVPAAFIDVLLEANVPFVILGRRVEHEQASFIAPDNYNGARTLMEHLFSLGHRRIGFTTRPAMGHTNEDRFNAYKDALQTAGIPYDPALVVETQIESRSGYYAVNQLLNLAEPPTAVFAFHDFVAIDAQQAILDRGLRIPQDIALAGFDGLRTSLFTAPPITTVSQPLAQIGQESVLTLLHLIGDNTHPPIQKTLPVELVIRQSTVA
ncbi:LacI family DNA-binding transcriptional regulator [Candidatus Leptofilum sp.]|uniref:LacI family DNA-binding transcriptional regulator n=1 Tax=Candidatus Leptofilum sp. TaxID=3241576 RepID=UPI003B5A9D02